MFGAIYLSCELTLPEVVRQVENLAKSDPYRRRGFDMPAFEIEVVRNSDADPAQTAFPDGFLRFPYKVEVEFTESNVQLARGVLAALLEYAWNRGWAAVAACDFEEELPRAGGYKCADLPWPSNG